MWSRLIYLLVITFLIGEPGLAHAQSNWQNFTSDSKAMSFSYPQDWQVIPTDRTPGRFLDNYAIQPAGQSFSGAAGQVAIRVFDPMYVIEEARVRLPIDPETLFQRFVQALPGGTYAAFSRRTYDAYPYFYARDTSGGFETDYVGFANRGGYVNVVALASNAREAAGWQNLLFRVVTSVRAPGPPATPDEPSAAVRNWYTLLRMGNGRALYGLACSQAQLSMLLVTFADPRMMDLMTRAATGFDFSGLRYQTIVQGPSAAMVRVSGNLVGPDGSVMPAYSSAALLGGSNSLLVKYENGGWRVCGPLRGGYQ